MGYKQLLKLYKPCTLGSSEAIFTSHTQKEVIIPILYQAYTVSFMPLSMLYHFTWVLKNQNQSKVCETYADVSESTINW
jgi:hypothetical protein